MSLTGTLNTALSGLQTTQQSLQIVGGNVANAQTPGYVRKTLTQIETGGGTSISVRSTSIDRQLDTLVQAQLRQATSGGSFADKLDSIYQQLQSVYGQPGSSSSIDTLFNNFTTALQTVSTSPSSFSAQSSAVNAAQLLSQQLNSMSNSIQSLRGAAEQGIGADVATANNDLQQIASINAQVSTANSNDPTTASLLDQRDKLIDQISTLMDVNVVPGQFNQVSVYTRNGTQLVGSTAVQLSFNAQGTLTPSTLYNTNPTKSGVGTITLKNADGTSTDLLAAGAIQSGEIAALVQMRDKVLPQAQTQLDELASQMSQALSNQTTTGTAVTVGTQKGFTLDTTALQNGNVVHLTYTDALNVSHNISIVRVDDPSVLPLPNSTTADPTDQVVGVNFAGGTLSTSSVISQLNTALGATGLQFSNAGGNTLQVLNNAGGSITVNSLSQSATMSSLTSGNPALPVFMDGTNLYTGAITANGLQELGYAQRISVNNALLSNPGDLVTFSTSPATPAGDSTRPTFLANQMSQATYIFSPTTGIGSTSQPLSGTLSSYVGEVLTQQGQAASNASSLKSGQDIVVNGLQQRMNTTSGVNVDQEMTNLITLQNTYAANARVFSTVQKMFETLLQI
jgi:flagellar hook-associated protein 1 FlgK